MPQYEYKVVPAPQKGQKSKGVRTNEGRFALAVEGLMNDLAAKGWEYLRAEMLPSIERSGLASSSTEWRHVMVFRRLRENDAALFSPELLPPPDATPPAPAALPQDRPEPAVAQGKTAADARPEPSVSEPATEEKAAPKPPLTVVKADTSDDTSTEPEKADKPTS
ncbi:MAG: DUF4177 domain-containing protein [Sulfitobacter sp.]|nr:DUF4177 domain-containing protein [Sulfitobacter sp.]